MRYQYQQAQIRVEEVQVEVDRQQTERKGEALGAPSMEEIKKEVRDWIGIIGKFITIIVIPILGLKTIKSKKNGR